MAMCYQCGLPLDKWDVHRRYVETGFSRRSYVSRRSYGVGCSTHYGLRSLCAECCIAVDREAAEARLQRSQERGLIYCMLGIVGIPLLIAFGPVGWGLLFLLIIYCLAVNYRPNSAGAVKQGSLGRVLGKPVPQPKVVGAPVVVPDPKRPKVLFIDGKPHWQKD